MRSEAETNLALSRYADMVRRICFVHLRNHTEVEDVFQDVFLKYVLSDKQFESEEHEKAWIIRVATNACKDLLKSFTRKNVGSLEEWLDMAAPINDDDLGVLEAITRLPTKYRTVIYLFYYEEYTAVEIAAILRRGNNTIYTWLDRARKQLRIQLGGDTLER